MKLMLLDDHRIVLDGLKAMLLGSEAEVMAVLQRPNDLREALKTVEPDIILMDIRMPEESGLDVCKWVKEQHPRVKVIFLSANLDSHTVTAGIKAGAYGFLPKETGEEELLLALRTVKEGAPYFGESIREMALQSYMQHIQHPEQTQKKQLTAREIDIIRLFADGLTYKEIGERLHISRRTVESHKENLLRKLELGSVMELVRYGIREGVVEA